jgi:hypothetical protein
MSANGADDSSTDSYLILTNNFNKCNGGSSLKITLALALILLLASTASARHEMVTAGQYVVSFDMNTTDDYSIKAAGPVGSEHDSRPIDYTISITGKSRSALVSISSEIQGTDISAVAEKEAVQEAFDLFQAESDAQFSSLTIDGQDAALGVGNYSENTPIFIAVYHKGIRPLNVLLKVMITSSYPWDDGTGGLLKSLKVNYYPLEHQAARSLAPQLVPRLARPSPMEHLRVNG